MFDLIRFFEKKEYVEDFLNGKLFMNSIGHFRKSGMAVQNDIAEGIGETLTPEKFDSKYKSNITTYFDKKHFLFPFMTSIEAMKYCHVCCFSLHEYDDNNKIVAQIPYEMRKMGKYAVIVRNVQKFVDTIYDKLVSEKLYGLMGPITYHAPTEELEYADLFDKYDNHSHEKEWRFALIPDYERAKNLAKEDENRVYDEHCYFNIGDIRHIAEEVDIDTLFNDIGVLYTKKSVKYSAVKEMPTPWSARRKEIDKIRNSSRVIPLIYDAYPNQYVGYGPREAFRNIIMSIDDGAFKPMFTIG